MVIISFAAAQQEAMGDALRIVVASNNFAVSIDTEYDSGERSRNINRRDVIPAEQKAMVAGRCSDQAGSNITVHADDVTARVHAAFVGTDVNNAWETDFSEGAAPDAARQSWRRPHPRHWQALAQLVGVSPDQ